MRVGTSGSRKTFFIMPISCSIALTPAGLPSTNSKPKRSVNRWCISRAAAYSPLNSSLIIRENSLGSALPMTLITPTAPHETMGNVRASSPLITSKSAGLFFIISSTCSRLPLASFIATIFLQSRASLTVVAAVMLTPVRPGTLYNTTGNFVAPAIALK